MTEPAFFTVGERTEDRAEARRRFTAVLDVLGTRVVDADVGLETGSGAVPDDVRAALAVLRRTRRLPWAHQVRVGVPSGSASGGRPDARRDTERWDAARVAAGWVRVAAYDADRAMLASVHDGTVAVRLDADQAAALADATGVTPEEVANRPTGLAALLAVLTPRGDR